MNMNIYIYIYIYIYMYVYIHIYIYIYYMDIQYIYIYLERERVSLCMQNSRSCRKKGREKTIPLEALVSHRDPKKRGGGEKITRWKMQPL